MQTETIKIAIVGYGNIGRYAIDAVEAAPDMECVGIVRRSFDGLQPTADGKYFLAGYPVATDIRQLGHVDVAILATPTRKVEEYARQILSYGINTVDSFDIHTQIVDLRRNLDEVAKQNGRVSIISAGWDPGSDSIVRTLMQSLAPSGISYTNFGPGRSMGHSVAVRAIEGVRDALSMTIPVGTGIHRRMVYVELEEGADFKKVEAAIKADPYFVNDETHVQQVDRVADLNDVGHGVNLVRKGVSGKTHNQMFEFNMHINNPALTSQVLVNVARASMRQQPGAYTMVELPVIDMLPGNREDIIRHLV
ncbi:MAG: diaminopimelate dehydrogenase [Bacteroidaceae bacterium]|nr:diaminopimelate dehydrogenase [Bacteroidaceae bacterium]